MKGLAEEQGGKRRRLGRTVQAYFSVGTVARLLEVSERTVQRWELAGKFPGSLVMGDDLRIPESGVRAFLDSCGRTRLERGTAVGRDVRTSGVGG